MKKLKQYKNNKGSSLLFVIISMAFVAIIGTLLSQLTVINLQMKKTDRKAKETFYTNETVLNEVQIVLEDISGDAMKTAYVDIVNDYANIANSPSRNLQQQFTYEYVKNLVNTLANPGTISDISNPDDYAKADVQGSTNYNQGVSKIKTDLRNGFSGSLESTGQSPDIWFKNQEDGSTPNVLEYVINNDGGGESYVILKNITVSYNTDEDAVLDDEEAVAHESTIITDIKLTAPDLTFQSGIFPKYTTYSIIANRYLNAKDTVEINGDLYGSAGIRVQSGTIKFTGPKTTNIITRGNFYTYQGASVTIEGDATGLASNDCVRVWANNFGTSRSSTSSGSAATTIRFTGDMFVQDDLVLDANASDVIMSGNNYYGFGYNRLNKRYDMLSTVEKRTDIDSQYSSAIIVNGTDASLDMSGMLSLRLAGRAYISRMQQSTTSATDLGEGYNETHQRDIMAGEAVSIKSNQVAYLIPGEAINGGKNPMQLTDYTNAINNNEDLVDSGMLQSVKKYLASTQYTTYCYNVQGLGAYVYFYYNFKSQDMANQYMAEYFKNNQSTLERGLRSNGYINATGHGIKLSSNIDFLSAACTGNIFEVTSSGTMTMATPIPDNNPDGDLTSLLGDAIAKAKEYYSMQLELSSEATDYPISGTADTGIEYRLEGENDEERSQDRPIYTEILSTNGENAFDTEGSTYAGMTSENEYGFMESRTGFRIKKVDVSAVEAGTAVYCIYPTSGDVNSVISIRDEDLKLYDGTTAKQGIILAACGIDMMVSNFKGIVISKGDVTVWGSTDLEADTQLVQRILTYGQQSITDPKQTFAHYFGFSNTGISTDPTTVDISAYISYSNWRNE